MPNLPCWCRLPLQGPYSQYYLYRTNTTMAIKQIILHELMIITFVIALNAIVL
jgi:hypothetical protein